MCKEREWLRASLDGELPEGEHLKLQTHLARCGACREHEQTLRHRAAAVSGAMDLLSAGATADPGFAYARWRARQFAEPAFAFGMFQPRERRPRRSEGLIGSLMVHLGLAGLVLAAGINPVVRQAAQQTVQIFAPVLPLPQQKQLTGGGGGGGDRSARPPDSGRLPQLSRKQFVPPQQVLQNTQPKLPMEPSIEVQPDLKIASNLLQFGNPMDGRSLPSNGPGSGGGIGTGRGGGIGAGDGRGLGIGNGSGFGGGVYHIGGGVSQPVPIFKPDPEYSEEARKAKFQGAVLLTVVVDAAGRVSHVQVSRSLGLGLDEKAIEAVQKWKFRPAMKDGRPVPVLANIEVNFRLL